MGNVKISGTIPILIMRHAWKMAIRRIGLWSSDVYSMKMTGYEQFK